ncbi:MAG: PAS domain S-box protein [Planctomycetota bacterium]
MDTSDHAASSSPEVADSSPGAPGAPGSRELRLRRFNVALTQLSRMSLGEGETRDSLFRQIAIAAANALDVRQASVWLFDEKRTRIECVVSARGARAGDDSDDINDHAAATAPIARNDAPAYFEALLQARAVAVENLADDPRTRDLLMYGERHDVRSLLDSPILLDGRLIGVVCHEHHEPRRWHDDEQSFAGSVADFAARIVGADGRRKAERELAASQRRLALHVEQTPLAVLECDTADRVVAWNPAAERIFGHRATDAMGMHWRELIDTPDRDRMADAFAQIKAGGGSHPVACGIRTRDGRHLSGEWYLTPLHDAAGQLVGVTALCMDTTDRQRARELLTARLAFEQLMGTISADFVTRADAAIDSGLQDALVRIGEFLGADCGWVHTSDAGLTGIRHAHAWRLPAAGLLSQLAATNPPPLPDWWLGPLHARQPVVARPGDRPGLDDEIEQLICVPIIVADQIAGFLGLAWMRGGGNWSGDQLERVLAQLRVAAGLFASALRRKAMEEALRISELRFRQVAETVDQVFWLGGADTGKPDYVSPRFETVFGLSVVDTMRDGWQFLDIVHPEDRSRVQQALSDNTRRVDIEYRILHHRTGDERWIRTVSYPVPPDDLQSGTLTMAGISEDITARKQAEIELRERETQLQHARKMEAFGRLAGGVAHDFNNLLTAITGTAQLARESLPADHPVQLDLVEIHKAGTRAAELTRQLLAFARRQVFAPAVVTVNETIRRLQHMLRRLIREDIDITIELDPTPTSVRVDPGQLEQVIVNLVVNASDAMPDGGTLTIRTDHLELGANSASRVHVDLKPGWYVTLHVIDTGIGIAPEILPRLFDPFFTTKPVGLGTGLGLSTCYGIVRQSEGVITVDSAPGRGSSFRVWLPRVAPGTDPAAQSDENQLPGGDETVLLVEDEAMVRKLTTRILSRLGYRILQASDGEEALRVMAQAGPDAIDLLVTDVVMPRMGGRELARRIRDLRPGLRVLFVSGYSDEAIAMDEPSAFLQKPFTMQLLAQRIRELLGS